MGYLDDILSYATGRGDDPYSSQDNSGNPILSEEQRKRILLGTLAPDIYPSINDRGSFPPGSEHPLSGDFGAPGSWSDPKNLGTLYPEIFRNGEADTTSLGGGGGTFDPRQTPAARPSIYEPGPNEAAYGEALRKPRPEYHEPKTKWWQNLIEGGLSSVLGPRTAQSVYQTPRQRAQEGYERQLGNYEGDIASKRGAASLEIGERDRQAAAARKNLMLLPEGSTLYDPTQGTTVATGAPKLNEADKEFQDWSPTHPGGTKLDYLKEKSQELGAAGERGRQSVPLRQPATSPDEQDAFDAYAAKNKIVGRPLSATEKELARAAHQQLIHPKDQEMAQANLVLKRLAIQNAQAKNPNLDFSKPLPNAADEVVANLLAQGKTVPGLLSKRTGDYNAVTARAAAINPNLDLTAAESNFRAGLQNQKQIRSFDAVNASLDNVLQTSKEFQRTNIGLLNDIILKGEVATNDPKAIRFQSAVTGVIDDAASALSGGGAVTDAARNQATRLFRSSYSQGGMEAAIDEVRNLISKRREAFSAGTVYDKNRGAAQRNRAEETLSDGSVWKKNPDGSRTRIK